jgi:galactokinase
VRKHSLSAKSRREPAIVLEMPRPDPVIARLGAIRDHRLRKAELELAQARRHAQAMRDAMREAYRVVEEAVETAREFWADTMQKFRSMELSLSEFLGCKGRHIKLKREVLGFREDAKRAVQVARDARHEIREAQKALQVQQLGVEKFRMMRDMEKEEALRKVVE